MKARDFVGYVHGPPYTPSIPSMTVSPGRILRLTPTGHGPSFEVADNASPLTVPSNTSELPLKVNVNVTEVPVCTISVNGSAPGISTCQ